MNIKQAKEQITNTLRAYLRKDEFGSYIISPVRQRPVLLIGPPGIGKTQIMEQIASEENMGLVSYTMTHHTRQSAIGLPFIEKRIYNGVEYTVTEYTMSEIIGAVYSLMEKTGIQEGILFLDEINCVSETLVPMMLQFLQCKTFGNQKLPEGWLIVAAGNPPEYNKSVREFDMVTLDRVRKIEVEEDYTVWKEYAVKKGIHGAITAYLDLKKENFYRIETTADGLRFATARGWEDLSEFLYSCEDMDIPVDETVVIQYIQLPELARDFANYYSLYKKYRQVYHIDDIIAGSWPAVTEKEFSSAAFDEKLAVMNLLFMKLSESARQCCLQDKLTSALYDSLLHFRSRIETEDPETVLQDLISGLQKSLEKSQEAGHENREESMISRMQIDKLENYLELIKSETGLDSDEVMEMIRAKFNSEVYIRSEKADETALAFDNAFRFLEKAAGQGQELVFFVTDLTAGSYTSWYIGEFGCDAYYRHNKELLFDETRNNIISKIVSP